jgi:hypothetical protein
MGILRAERLPEKPWWKRKLFLFLMPVALLLLAAGGAVAWWLHQLAPMVKARAERLISDRFAADAKLDRLELRLLPSPHVTGHGLAVRKKGSAGEPFLAVKRFTADTDWATLVGQASHKVAVVRLEGLVIQMAHGTSKPIPSSGTAAVAAPASQPIGAVQAVTMAEPAASDDDSFPFEIEQVVADGSQLVILPRDATKQPLVFDIPKLTLRSVGLHQPMSFVATVRNLKPPGMVQTIGNFGPWRKAELVSTPLSGHYTFTHADLSVFRGITGTLSSQGQYQGVLDHIAVEGETDTPDFTVSTGQHRVALHTDFHAIVDGANGDTILDPVVARFLGTEVVCRGAVEGKRDQPGKTVSLHVTASKARIQDLLRLCLKSEQPIVTGAVNFQASFVLPPGKEVIMHKLTLNGDFLLPAAQFTDPNIRAKLEQLSLRSRGIARKKDQAAQQQEEGIVTSNLSCRLNLNRGMATLSDVSFAVPGALIQLSGTYDLRSVMIDLRGQARLDARLSQMTTGFKSVLLRLADPFFAKDGAGTLLPIRITGPADHPAFALEWHRAKN